MRFVRRAARNGDQHRGTGATALARDRLIEPYQRFRRSFSLFARSSGLRAALAIHSPKRWRTPGSLKGCSVSEFLFFGSGDSHST
jgi:hypothetical protein